MKNYIARGYEKVDNALVSVANKAARGWNWATGETKSQLANKLLTVAPILETLGIALIPENAQVGAMFAANSAPCYLWGSHGLQKRFSYADEVEQSASNNGLKNIEVEQTKRMCKVYGPIYGSCVPTIAPFIYSRGGSPEGLITLGSGHLTRALATYVMRGDYLPPRKNCAERGLEKVVEKYRELTARPVPCPVYERDLLGGGR